MVNIVAYPDLALDKLIGSDSSEVFIRLFEEKISFSSDNRPAKKENNVETVFDNQSKALFRSV